MATKNNAQIRAARKARFPVEQLRAHVGYDPVTGQFTRLISSNRSPAGQRIGALHPSSGFICFRALGFTQQAHRVAWALMTGEWPSGPLDFKNGDCTDCRWGNLRLAKVGKVALTQEYVKASLHYDPDTGTFTWLNNPDKSSIWNSRWAGKTAGTFDKDGYVCITIAKNWAKAHRLAVLYMTGEWPPADVDHADLNPSNNRWSNLRLASRTDNNGNRAMSGNAASGMKGVYLSPTTGRWYSRIQRGAISETLGTYATKEEAREAYQRAAERLFGEFARTR